jgi:signal transduction histidine kinase
VYVSNSRLVIDIADDGPGVAHGSEELVFLRFYQDPATSGMRRGKRGLGLGLFLARHLAERHMGQLTFVRQRGMSVFRFLWPMTTETTGEGAGGGHAA